MRMYNFDKIQFKNRLVCASLSTKHAQKMIYRHDRSNLQEKNVPRKRRAALLRKVVRDACRHILSKLAHKHRILQCERATTINNRDRYQKCVCAQGTKRFLSSNATLSHTHTGCKKVLCWCSAAHAVVAALCVSGERQKAGIYAHALLPTPSPMKSK